MPCPVGLTLEVAVIGPVEKPLECEHCDAGGENDSGERSDDLNVVHSYLLI
jgi:hypothetical protein